MLMKGAGKDAKKEKIRRKRLGFGHIFICVEI